MNLEDFFIAEFEKTKKENEQLKEQNAELRKQVNVSELLDVKIIQTDVDAVKVAASSYWDLRDYFRGKTAAYVEEKKNDIDNAVDWPGLSYYRKPILLTEKNFAMLIKVKVLGNEREYLVDEDCKLEPLKNGELDEWSSHEYENELLSKAKDELLVGMDEVIERLKQEEKDDNAS
mgnify:CR=1 FL=1